MSTARAEAMHEAATSAARKITMLSIEASDADSRSLRSHRFYSPQTFSTLLLFTLNNLGGTGQQYTIAGSPLFSPVEEQKRGETPDDARR